jgi:hypothetical protein
MLFKLTSAAAAAIMLLAGTAHAGNAPRIELKDGTWKTIRGANNSCSIQADYTDGATLTLGYNAQGQIDTLNIGLDFAKYITSRPDHIYLDFGGSDTFSVDKKNGDQYQLANANGAALVNGILNGKALNLRANGQLAATYSLDGSFAASLKCAQPAGNDDLTQQERSNIYKTWQQSTASTNFDWTGKPACRTVPDAKAIMKCAGDHTYAEMKKAIDFVYNGCLARSVASPARCAQIRDTSLSAVTDWLMGR